MLFRCAYCRREADKPTGEVNRARRRAAPLYCGRLCMGLARQKHVPDAEKKRQKAAYDEAYRALNRETRKAQKAAYHKATYDPEKAREERKAKMPAHIEYCRQPSYRAWKRDYDRRYRTQKEYGPFWEAASLLFDVEEEVRSRATDYEIRVANGTLNKALQRKRDDARDAKPERR